RLLRDGPVAVRGVVQGRGALPRQGGDAGAAGGNAAALPRRAGGDGRARGRRLSCGVRSGGEGRRHPEGAVRAAVRRGVATSLSSPGPTRELWVAETLPADGAVAEDGSAGPPHSISTLTHSPSAPSRVPMLWP